MFYNSAAARSEDNSADERMNPLGGEVRDLLAIARIYAAHSQNHPWNSNQE